MSDPLKTFLSAGAGAGPGAEETSTSSQLSQEDERLEESARKMIRDEGKGPRWIRPVELRAIAEKHGVDSDWLRGMVGFFGGHKPPSLDPTVAGQLGEAATETGKYAAHVASEVAFGIPQWVYKKSLEKNEEDALDDLRALVQERKPLHQKALELGTSVLVPGTLGFQTAAKTLTRSLAGRPVARAALAGGITGVGTGSVSGATSSRRGQELEGAAWGGALGAAGGFALGGAAGKLAAKKAGVQDLGLDKLADEVSDAASGRVAGETARLETPAAEAARVAAASDVGLEFLGEVTSRRVRGSLPDEETTKRFLPFLSSEIQERVKTGNLPEATRRLLKQAGVSPDKYSELATSAAVEAEVGRQASKFSEYLGLGSLKPSAARRKLADLQAREGSDFVRQQWANFRAREATSIEKIDRTLGVVEGFALDGKFVARLVDERHGTKLGVSAEDVVDRTAEALNIYKNAVNPVARRAEILDTQLRVATRERSREAAQIGRALEDQSTYDSLSPEARAVADNFSATFEAVRQAARKLGLPVEALKDKTGKLRGYLPHVPLDAPSLVRATEREAKRVGYTPGQEKPAPAEFVEGLGALVGRKLDAGDAADVATAYREVTVLPILQARLRSAAGSTFERGEVPLPAWAREFDPRVLLSRWTASTFKHALVRDVSQEMTDLSGRLAEAGDTRAATWFSNLAGDLLGAKRGIPGSTSRVTDAWRLRLGRAADAQRPGSVASSLLETASHLPEMLGVASRQIYANYLGLNARAIIRNLTQPILLTAPELGVIGYKNVLQATGRALYQVLRHPSAVADELSRRGLAPPDLSPQGALSLSSALRDSSVVRASSDTLLAWSKLALNLYQKTDLLNRQITAHLADTVVDSLMRGDKSASSYVGKLPELMRGHVQKLAAAGDTEQLRRFLARQLNSTTQFNYSPASLGEYGRVLGPLFSTFTKWPASVAGDIYSSYARSAGHGNRTLALKYLAPLVGTWATARAFDLVGEDADLTSTQKQLLGVRPTDAAPLTSLAPLLSIGDPRGETFTPPIVRLAGPLLQEGIRAVTQGEDYDPAGAERAVGELYRGVAPGAGLLRFLGEDIPNLVGDEADYSLPFHERFGDSYSTFRRHRKNRIRED